jgi:diketogulonate reductase-like aldo/keto reductase
MHHVDLPGGGTLPALGLGTWRFGEADDRRVAEVAAVRRAIELGYRLIDTAEMYGEGGAETVVGQAVAEAVRAGDVRREDLTIVSKVYPHNASRSGTPQACDRSRRRLGLDRIDLYLLHWRGSHPLPHTVAAMQALADAGAIGRWGVSNFDLDDMQALQTIVGDVGASPCATNQVYYSPSERGPEFALLPWMRGRGVPLMAYSPIDQGSLAAHDTLADIGRARGLTAAQVALAWVVSQPGVLAIPKATSEAHLRENLAAADVVLTDEDRRRIDARFKPPRRKTPLAMI